MKKSFIVAVLLFSVADTQAQKEPDGLPFKKERPDSAWGVFPRLRQQPFGSPSLRENSTPFNNGKKTDRFEEANPGATLLYKTSKGSVYRIPLDNMAVLVPDMSAVENMPGRRAQLKLGQADKMPNPYYPHQKDNKRN